MEQTDGLHIVTEVELMIGPPDSLYHSIASKPIVTGPCKILTTKYASEIQAMVVWSLYTTFATFRVNWENKFV